MKKSLIYLWLLFTLSYGATYTVRNASELEGLPTLSAGDEVILSAGNYDNVDATLTFNGTSASLVVVHAIPAGGAKFTGNTRITLAGSYGSLSGLKLDGDGGNLTKEGAVIFAKNSSHITLHNCHFRNFDYGTQKDAIWVFMAGYDHAVQYCSFEQKTTVNTYLSIKPTEGDATKSIPRNHKISFCYFGERVEIGSNGYEAIRIADSARQEFETNCLVENNYFYRAINSTTASEMEVISNKSRGNVFRRNVFEDNDGQLTLRHGRDCVVEENCFIGTGGSRESGIRVVGTGHVVRNNYITNVRGDGLRAALCVMDGQYGLVDNTYEGVKKTLIHGNVIINCKESINFGENKGLNDPPINTTFTDNRIYNNVGDTLFTIESDSHFSTVSGNLVYSTGGLGDTALIKGGITTDANLDQSIPFKKSLDVTTTGHDFTTPPLLDATLF